MTEKKKCVMTIAGSDSGGGAGIEADLKTFAALGVHGTCVLASVTSQNTTGVQAVFDIPVETIGTQMDSILSDFNVAYAKTGMLSSPQIVTFVAEKIKEHKIPLIVDPVMAAETGGKLLQKEAVQTLSKELLPTAFAVTPNVFEAEILSGMTIQTAEDAKAAAQKIANCGVSYVIVTGGHLEATDIVYDSQKDEFTLFHGTFVKGGTHGTGCTYSSALTAYLARGYLPKQACRLAKEFVVRAILYSERVGNGVSPVNPVGSTVIKSVRANVIENILTAYDILKADPLFPTLVPEIGTNIAMSLPDIFKNTVNSDYYASKMYPNQQACQTENISDSFGTFLSVTAAFPGRIRKVKDKTGKLTAEIISAPSFGSGSNLSKVIRSAQEFDETVCACINLKYSPKIIESCQNAGLTAIEFIRDDEPSDFDAAKEWGTWSIVKRTQQVPDIVYDVGGFGKEGVLRVLGTDAFDTAYKVIRICNEMRKEKGK